MMNLREFAKAIDQIAREKDISREQVIDTIEAALGAAYKKEYRQRGEVVRAVLDFDNNTMSFKQIKTVVDPDEVRIVEEDDGEGTEGDEGERKLIKSVDDIAEEVEDEEEEDEEDRKPRYNPHRHIFLEEAKEIKKDAEVGEDLEFPLEMHEDFGRIAAQTAKQVIIQKLREAERQNVYAEYKNREGELVSGIVQNYDRGNVYVNLGKATGIMFPNESIPGERYESGQRLRFFVLGVQEEGRLPGVILSRSHPEFIEKLFELEVPEIAEEIIEIKGIAREPGNRTKLAVASNEENVDPVGSCVGQRGSRVMAVINELGREKIDIIPWSEDLDEYIANALSPAKVKYVEVLDRREAVVYVAEDQLSLAIGKGGQNVRLAAKLTGWKIDVRSQDEPDQEQEGGSAGGEDADESGEVSAPVPQEPEAESEVEATGADIETIPGIGPKAVSALRDAGYDTVNDLHNVSQDDLIKVEGIGEKTAEKIIEFIQEDEE